MSDDLLRVAGEASWTKTLAELRALSDDQLVLYHDALATGPSPAPRRGAGPAYWRDELHRREEAAKTDAMVRLTRVITVLTAVNVVAAIVAALAAAVAIVAN
jgi:hypothetical protein